MKISDLYSPKLYELVCVDCGFRDGADLEKVDLDEKFERVHRRPGFPSEHPDYLHRELLVPFSEMARATAREELNKVKIEADSVRSKFRRRINKLEKIEWTLAKLVKEYPDESSAIGIEESIDSIRSLISAAKTECKGRTTALQQDAEPFREYLRATDSTASRLDFLAKNAIEHSRIDKLRQRSFHNNGSTPHPTPGELNKRYPCIHCGSSIQLRVAEQTSDWGQSYPRILVESHELPNRAELCPNSLETLTKKDLAWISKSTKTKSTIELPKMLDATQKDLS